MKAPEGLYKYVKDPGSVSILTEGGSERNFYRVTYDGDKTLIYMHYTDEKEENEFYYDISVLLNKIGINVPKIYHRDKGSIFLEDLGNTHLYNLVSKNKEENIEGYYYRVMDQISRLHSMGMSVYEKKGFKISAGFNYALYRWESGYFLDNLIKNYFKFNPDKGTRDNLESDFHFIADILSKEKSVLVHRDCQSKNIMIKDDTPYFIDFQGLRPGLLQYDLASLIEDPYVNLSSGLKERLLEYYLSKAVPDDASQNKDKTRFFNLYRYCAVQRLMQALGAYAFLGLKKGKKEFLDFIPSGLKKLSHALIGQNDLRGIDGLVKKLSKDVPVSGGL